MFDPDPELIDYHCHLDLYQDYIQQFQTCETKRIATLAVTTTPRAWETNRNLAAGSKFVRIALGLHPQLVGELGNEIALFEKLLPKTRFVGEVGLDASPPYYASFQKQKEVFERILRHCGAAGGKILSVHSVRATRQVLDLIEEFLPSCKGKVVLHWFSGTQTEAKRAAQLGCWFSLNREMFQNPDRHSLIASLPLNRILTETDGPFTKGGKGPAQPLDIAGMKSHVHTCPRWVARVGSPVDTPRLTIFLFVGGTRSPSIRRNRWMCRLPIHAPTLCGRDPGLACKGKLAGDFDGNGNPALFVSLALPHERMTIGGVETRLREIGRHADLQKVHPHKFRRTLATRAIDRGMPIEQVQCLLGHVKIDTTMHYAMVNQANVKNSHRKFIA